MPPISLWPCQTAAMVDLPTGTVTFMLTDIESSSTHWEDAPEEMRAALSVHDSVVAAVVADHGGHVVKHVGDGNWCAFDTAPDAARAAIEVQRRLQEQPRAIQDRLLVRIGLHTGDVIPTGGDYFGGVPNRMARVADLANGGQIVCSSATAGLLTTFELGSEGMHELRGIGVDEIFLLTSHEFISDVRPLRRPVVPHNLPVIRTSFLGRDLDIEKAMHFLGAGHGVVTLLGPGGVGKTRLAVEIGTAVARSSSNTVVFCDLAAVREEEDVIATVADGVGARQQPAMDLLASIADYLHNRDALIILDNCEQVVSVVRDIVERLTQAEGVKILATSRSALHATGEQLMDVEPLPSDTAGFDLFVSRALEQDPGFELDEQGERLVREITKRLDGIPLAIELAAARVRVMSPLELVAGLEDRFNLLSSGQRRGRQETLRDTVMWSYQLLTAAEAAVFARMSVFAGGATLGAIADICADGDLVHADDVPDIVLSLAQQSMLVGRTTDGYRRFRLLETMRGFGHEVLVDAGEHHTYRDRHARHFAHLAGHESQRLFTADEHDVWRVLDAEWVNLRRALDTLIGLDDVDAAVELVADLVYYATFAMRFELFTWADELLEIPGIENHPSFGQMCGAAAVGAYFTVSGRATQLAETGLAADPSDPQGWCRVALAAIFLNNVHTAEASDEMTSAWLATDPTAVGNRLWCEAFRTFHLCSHGFGNEAVPHGMTTVQIARETGSVSANALAAWAQGMVISFHDLDAAIAMWTEAREGPRSMPRDHLVEHLLVGLVLHFTVHQHQVDVALESCRAALRSALDSHYYAGTSHLFGVAAIALCRGGDAETGAKLVGAMIGNGHLPRANATAALDRALGDDRALHQSLGAMLSVTQAGHLALDAIQAAIDRQQQ